MNVIEFCDEYNKQIEKSTYIKNIIKRRYCPISEKMAIIQINSENAVQYSNQDIVFINKMVNKIDFVHAVIILYTNLKYNTDENGKIQNLKCYDALISSGVFAMIEKEIGNDINELNELNGLALKNAYDIHCSPMAYIISQLNSVSDIVLPMLKEKREILKSN